MSLIDEVLSKDNLNEAYKQVTRNKGAAGIDEMTCDEVLDYLKVHGDELISQIKSRSYVPLPVRRVEIPKPNGGVRKLGVPTVIDRIVQQALVQVLSPRFEETFSEYSYGFRPNRRAQNAVDKTLEYLNEGYTWIIDLDLEKFFDNVPHDKLIRLVDNVIHDGDIASLIMKYLKSGVMINDEVEATNVGTPQGGNLSPLLSNIMLNELDKELERRNLRFARYADDCVIFVKTEYSANRVMQNIIRFIETKLKLKVSATKTHVTTPNRLKFLGFSFYYETKTKTWKSAPHAESFAALKRKLKKLLSRRWSISLTNRITKLNQVLRGWINYFKGGMMKIKMKELGEYVRRRVRVIIWKQWKTVFKRMTSLVKLGLSKNEAKCVANSRKGIFHLSGVWSITKAITNERLKKRGLIDPLEYYLLKIA